MVTEKDIIADLIQIKNSMGQMPTKTLYHKAGLYHPSTVSRKFGSWNKALQTAFQSINRTHNPRSLHSCAYCGKETKNPSYCSQSCASSRNNTLYPKRFSKTNCIECGQPSRSHNNICKRCLTIKQVAEFGDKTLGQFCSTYARHRYQAVRNHAHRVAILHQMPKFCTKCNYSMHVELCHKLSIGSFSKDTKLSIINNPNNLVFLCRNHHWEFENGLLEL